MKKNFIVLLIISCITNAMVFAGGQGESSEAKAVSVEDFKPVVWKFAHTRNENSRAHQAVVKFAKTLETETNGKIKLEIYPAQSLGDYETVQERITVGDVAFQMSDPGQNIDKSLILPTIPYLLSSWDDVEKHTTMGSGKLANFISERLALQNIKVINNYPQYFASIVSKNPIPEPENPTAKRNLKMRVPTSKAFERLGNEFGFTSTPLPSSEIFTSLQTGIIDGYIGGGTEYAWMKYKDVINYILPVNTHYVSYWLVMNMDMYNSLPDEFKKIIDDAGKVLHNEGMLKAKAEDRMYNENFEKQGSTVYWLTDDEVAKYANHYRSVVWPELVEQLGDNGKKIFNEFRDMYGIKY